MKILICDDERQFCDALSTILKQNNYSVDCAYNGIDGVDLALSGIYDLIILDVMMPKCDGFSVVKQLRDGGCNTPVLMLTAKNDVADKVFGFSSGADDYLTKPFDTQELLARIKALLRRKSTWTGDILTYGDIILNRDTFSISCNEKSIVLGKKEFNIIEMLILASGRTINKEKFIEKIWGFDTDAEYNTIEVYISFLRKKLSAIHSKIEIKSIRSVGYTLGKKDD